MGAPSLGRGAWICLDAACCRKVQAHPEILSRSLRCAFPDGDLVERVRRWVTADVVRSLGSLARDGGIRPLVGTPPEGVAAVIVSADASARVVRRTQHLAHREVVRCPLDRLELGRLIGRGERASALLLEQGCAAEVVRKLRFMAALG